MVSKLSRGIVPAVLAIVLVAAVAHVASSSSGGMSGPMGHHGFHGMHGGMDALGMPLPLLLRTANLTDAQKQQIHTIFENRRAARKAEYQQLHAAKEAIAAKFTSTGAVAASDLSSSGCDDDSDSGSDDERADSGRDRDSQRADSGAARANLRDQGQARFDSRRDESAVGAKRQLERFNPDRVATSPIPPSDPAGSRPSKAATPSFLNTGCRGHPCPRKRETHGGFHIQSSELSPANRIPSKCASLRGKMERYQ